MIYTVTLNPAIDIQYVVSNIDFDRVLRASTTHLDLGGKGFNVSRMLAELGAESTALGLIAGEQGKSLSEGLHGLGIRTKLIEIAGETRINVSIVSQHNGQYVKVNGSGPEVSQSVVDQLLEQIKSLAGPDDWWVLSGSVPPGVSDDIYAEVIASLREAGAHTILDTSGDPLVLGIRARPTLVKPNAKEAHEVTRFSFNGLLGTAVAAKRIRDLGAENVVISLGEEGALLTSEEEIWFAAAPKVDERTPVGAGDSLVAGMVSRLVEGESIPEALSWGIACGSASASQSGTSKGMRHLISELHSQISMEEISSAIYG